MAARSRPRAGQLKDDFDEERNIWNSIRRDAQKVDEMLVRSMNIALLFFGKLDGQGACDSK